MLITQSTGNVSVLQPAILRIVLCMSLRKQFQTAKASLCIYKIKRMYKKSRSNKLKAINLFNCQHAF